MGVIPSFCLCKKTEKAERKKQVVIISSLTELKVVHRNMHVPYVSQCGKTFYM